MTGLFYPLASSQNMTEQCSSVLSSLLNLTTDLNAQVSYRFQSGGQEIFATQLTQTVKTSCWSAVSLNMAVPLSATLTAEYTVCDFVQPQASVASISLMQNGTLVQIAN